MTTYVIDSWPILEWLLDNAPAAEQFERFMDQAIANESRLVMSRMNYGEVIYSLAKPTAHPKTKILIQQLQSLPIAILSVDDALIDEAAALKSHHKISYADCFAAALSIRFKAPVVTGDPEFLKLRDQGLLMLEWMGA